MKEIIIILYNNYFWLFITSVVLFVLLIIYLKSKGYKSYGKIGFLLFSVSITLWLSNGILKHYSDNTSNQGTGYIEETTGAINIVEQFAWDYTISIGEKIKKLLDSGCWVEVKCDKGTITFIAHDSEYEFANSRNNKHLYSQIEKREILSIKPIARPLYQYKVGDKVVVLDNYEEDRYEIGNKYKIAFVLNGTAKLQNGPIDIRCIAPVLD